jgi:hypothetical protein
MPIVSGIGGLVDAERCIREWKIRYENVAKPIVHSSSQSGVQRACGIEDWKGFFTGYGHTPVVFPGDTFEFKGGVNASLGAYSGADEAIVDRIVIIWDAEQGKEIEYRVDFSSNGTLTIGPTSAADAGTPEIVCAQTMTVSIGGSPVGNIRYMRLEMFCENRPYVDTGTAGKRLRSPGNFDARYEYRVYYQDTPTTFPTLNTPQIYKFNCTSDPYFWELKWMMAETIEDFGANREGAENVGATIKGAFSGWYGTSAGYVKTPAAAPVTKWPFS